MTISATRMTADELLRLDDGLRHELIRGEPTAMSPSGSLHVIVIARLTRRLVEFVEREGLGLVFGAEGGFLLERDPDTVLAPDVAFVRRERIPSSGIPEGFWIGPPDLAVEVVSPSDSLRAVRRKAGEWLAAGCREVWVVDPARRTAEIHGAGGNSRATADELTSPDLLPGFVCRTAGLFP